MKIKIDCDIELTERQAETLCGYLRLPLEKLEEFMPTFVRVQVIGAIMRMAASDLAEMLREQLQHSEVIQ